ncbi:hypothetical protein C2845_PM15G09050 [Panicum miliaceum]|uniref:F-box domain-containing protein n=1 Tax=Panicum miliaceum TaxID=4540 RepID=A0A3L6Q4N0_PANMI|nr:hypothetical protein C2845_PM15G09050 [Panicum miliaceum]
MDMETPAASRDGGRGRVAADRLSALPDHVLLNVLSCLTSLQAARTSALSRRWRHLWRAVPCIDIDQSEFLRPPRPAAADLRPTRVHAFYDAAKEEHERLLASIELRDRFEDLGDRLSLRHDASSPPLDALRLRVACDDFRAALKWIRRGLARRPAALFLRCDNDYPEDKVKDRRWPCFPTAYAAGSFTCRLRTLRLSGLRLTREFADALAAGFPVLEDMQLQECRCELRRLASASLKKLSIEFECHGLAYKFDELVLMAPSLVSLRLGDAPPITMQCLTSSVVEATLMHRAGDLGVLRSLRGARTLKLFWFSRTALLDDGEPGGFPVFGNLRTLLLDGCDVGAQCHVLRRFLGNAPGLETLTLRNCLRSGVFSGGSAPTSRSRKRKASAKRKRSDDQRAPAAYPCRNLKLIELEFEEDHALSELAGALRDISKEVVHPIEGSVQDGRRTIKIKYT